MFTRVFKFVGLTTLFACPVVAQFGVAGGNRKAGGSFQELNEQAKKMQAGGGGGDLGDLSKLMGDLDPKMLEEMAGLGAQFDEVMKMMAQMSPEELEKQMKDAMEMMQSGDMMKNMMENQDEILKALEEAGQIDAEELAKFKTDPEYFEQKMKESFDQMGQLFSDPDVLKMATESMAGLKDMYNNPNAMNEMMGALLADFDSDEKIEEARQMLLSNPEMAGMFDDPEMKKILNDPKKWRDTVKEGSSLLTGGAGGLPKAGAGVGEL